MTASVHMLAIGARCAVGLDAESAAAAIRASISGVAEHPFLRDAVGEHVLCGCDPVIDPTIMGGERLVHLARHAVGQTLRKLSHVHARARGIRVFLALPEPRPGFSPADAQFVERGLASPNGEGAVAFKVERFGEGHAGALAALAAAAERIWGGSDEIYVVAGVDSYLHARTIKWLDSERLLARADVRSGFPPGEAAAAIALAGDAVRRQLGLASLARVRGVACTLERRSRDSDEGLFGEALTDAILQASAGLALPGEMITDVYGDINGERARTEDWGFALMRTSERFRDGTRYIAPVAECGDIGAATAAFACVLAVRAWQRGYARGMRALVWSGSWGGLRAAAVLEREG
jgi:3-oxoacyl-[acyl-carrier-protein] synthase-1